MQSQQIMALAGGLRESLSPGNHEIEVRGLGTGGLALADAPPVGGGDIVRRRDIFELSPKEPLVYQFRQKAGESLALVLFIATEASTRPWRIRYTIDGGKQTVLTGSFFKSITVPAGEISGRTGDLGSGIIWEAKRDPSEVGKIRDGLSRGRIPIGDDLKPGLRTIKIESYDRLWIAAVLVGQAGLPNESDPRMWAEDDL
jgi:hypothetical protein